MKDAPFLHAVEYGAYRALEGGARLLPLAAARRLGAGLGRVGYALLGGRRRRALANLALALPEAPQRLRRRWARRSFENLGAELLDVVCSARLDAVELCGRWSLEGLENLEVGGPDGRPSMLMTAHLGFWEVLPLAVGLYAGGSAIVVRPLDNPRLEARISAARTRFGGSIIPKRGAARGMLRTLSGGRRVSILIDQRPGPGEGVPVPFFGRPALTSPLLARMALRFELPVQPCFAYPQPGGRYRLVFRAPIPPQGDDATALTARYIEAIEREVRPDPGLWLWMHDRWRTT